MAEALDEWGVVVNESKFMSKWMQWAAQRYASSTLRKVMEEWHHLAVMTSRALNAKNWWALKLVGLAWEAWTDHVHKVCFPRLTAHSNNIQC